LNISSVNNFVDGKFSDSSSNKLDVWSPINGKKISEVNLSNADELDKIVSSAQNAFKSWSQIVLKDRAKIFYKFRDLLQKNIDDLAVAIREENGKTIVEARAEVMNGIELAEFASSMPQIINDEIQVVSKGVECRSSHYPLGVVGSITPFNFPIMVPLWTILNSIVLGNTMILKPSEKTPLGATLIAKLLTEAGLPNGVFNIINGDKNIVEAMCNHKSIKALTFVGSTKVAKIVYRSATASLKRCISLGGAKNHLILLPDAHKDMAANDIINSMSGCAGQRCMAASAMVAVGDTQSIIEKICEKALTVIPGKNLGAVISKESKSRIEKYISDAEKAGAKVLVDGRGVIVEGKEDGYYVGPTVIDYAKPDMAIAKEEVFGPVLVIIRTNDIDEAIAIENSSNYGNASSVYTQNGNLSDYVTKRVSAGMVGVNIGVPVPKEPFSFGGWNDSRFGAGDITGKSSIYFWTKLKKRTTKWNPEAKKDWMT
tara:strand:- start:4730 stop:6184 length:1455 start_codon:yes stop_codon:yes gene_type:complete